MLVRKADDISGKHCRGLASTEKMKYSILKISMTVFGFQKLDLWESGVTLSEFLTRWPHDLLMDASQKLGTANCWTNRWANVVFGDGGKLHTINLSVVF